MIYSRVGRNNTFLYLLFWLLISALYLPARNAGLVSDTTGWLQDIQQSSFSDHINRTHFKVKSLYQFTQLVTWFFYQLFGTRAWCWHVLHVSMHAFNCLLLFRIMQDIFNRDKVTNAGLIIACGCVLFCVAPSVSEVIVWEASFHYLLGLMILLGILRLLQYYLQNPAPRHLIPLLLLYFLSTYSIELFYVSPFFVAVLLVFYRQHYPYAVNKAWLRLWLPMMLLLVLHFVQVKLCYGHWLPHINAEVVTDTDQKLLWSKPLKYLFHLLLLGRFFSHETRDKVYAICESYMVLISIYGLLLYYLAWNLRRLKDPGIKSGLVLMSFSGLTMALVVPLWFPQHFWVVFDRYTYFFTAFFFILLSYALFQLLGKRMALVLLLLFGLANTFALYKVNKKWQDTAVLIRSLMTGLPAQSDKTVLLLNMPQCMNGIFMICGGHYNEAKTMHDAIYPPPVTYPLLDVCAYNILSVKDGAHVQVLNDSTFRVTLNQYGTWWWFNDMGGVSYENEHYRLDMKDYSHYYELTLKKNPSGYLLLFQNGDHWVKVDPAKKDVEQY